jgi:hypothetical protein
MVFSVTAPVVRGDRWPPLPAPGTLADTLRTGDVQSVADQWLHPLDEPHRVGQAGVTLERRFIRPARMNVEQLRVANRNVGTPNALRLAESTRSTPRVHACLRPTLPQRAARRQGREGAPGVERAGGDPERGAEPAGGRRGPGRAMERPSGGGRARPRLEGHPALERRRHGAGEQGVSVAQNATTTCGSRTNWRTSSLAWRVSLSWP